LRITYIDGEVRCYRDVVQQQRMNDHTDLSEFMEPHT